MIGTTQKYLGIKSLSTFFIGIVSYY